jgi:hypothetical protein
MLYWQLMVCEKNAAAVGEPEQACESSQGRGAGQSRPDPFKD